MIIKIFYVTLIYHQIIIPTLNPFTTYFQYTIIVLSIFLYWVIDKNLVLKNVEFNNKPVTSRHIIWDYNVLKDRWIPLNIILIQSIHLQWIIPTFFTKNGIFTCVPNLTTSEAQEFNNNVFFCFKWHCSCKYAKNKLTISSLRNLLYVHSLSCPSIVILLLSRVIYPIKVFN